MQGVFVVGANSSAFNPRTWEDIMIAVLSLWKLRAVPQLQQRGTLYFPPESEVVTNLSPTSFLSSLRCRYRNLPVPTNHGICCRNCMGFFAKYDCSEVHRLSDISILDQRLRTSAAKNWVAQFIDQYWIGEYYVDVCSSQTQLHCTIRT
jgi:hypothetical protein